MVQCKIVFKWVLSTEQQCFIKLVLKSISLPLLRPTNNKPCSAKLVSIRFNCSEFSSRPENVTSRFHTYNALQCRRFLLMCILWPGVLHSALWNLKNFLLMFILLLVYCTLCWMDDLGQLALMSGGHWPEPPLTLWSLPRKFQQQPPCCVHWKPSLLCPKYETETDHHQKQCLLPRRCSVFSSAATECSLKISRPTLSKE